MAGSSRNGSTTGKRWAGAAVAEVTSERVHSASKTRANAPIDVPSVRTSVSPQATARWYARRCAVRAERIEILDRTSSVPRSCRSHERDGLLHGTLNPHAPPPDPWAEAAREDAPWPRTCYR